MLRIQCPPNLGKASTNVSPVTCAGQTAEFPKDQKSQKGPFLNIKQNVIVQYG